MFFFCQHILHNFSSKQIDWTNERLLMRTTMRFPFKITRQLFYFDKFSFCLKLNSIIMIQLSRLIVYVWLEQMRRHLLTIASFDIFLFLFHWDWWNVTHKKFIIESHCTINSKFKWNVFACGLIVQSMESIRWFIITVFMWHAFYIYSTVLLLNFVLSWNDKLYTTIDITISNVTHMKCWKKRLHSYTYQQNIRFWADLYVTWFGIPNLTKQKFLQS